MTARVLHFPADRIERAHIDAANVQARAAHGLDGTLCSLVEEFAAALLVPSPPVIRQPENPPTWTDEQRAAFKAEWERRYPPIRPLWGLPVVVTGPLAGEFTEEP